MERKGDAWDLGRFLVLRKGVGEMKKKVAVFLMLGDAAALFFLSKNPGVRP